MFGEVPRRTMECDGRRKIPECRQRDVEPLRAREEEDQVAFIQSRIALKHNASEAAALLALSEFIKDHRHIEQAAPEVRVLADAVNRRGDVNAVRLRWQQPGLSLETLSGMLRLSKPYL